MTRRSSHRRAFTVIELMLALSLATLVLSGVFAMFSILYRTQSQLSATTGETVDLATTQMVIRRTMNTLVGGVPLANEVATELPDEGPEEPESLVPEDELDLEQIQALIAGLEEEPEDEESQLDEFLEESEPAKIHFELYYDEDPFTGLIQPMLTVITSESPVQRSRDLRNPDEQYISDQLALMDEEYAAHKRVDEATKGHTEGGFQIATIQTREGPTQVLQWVWLDDPFLEPFVLISDIDVCIWQVLVKELPEEDTSPKIWTDVYAAYLADDFPAAVRLQFSTTDGLYVDWIFETAVLAQEPLR